MAERLDEQEAEQYIRTLAEHNRTARAVVNSYDGLPEVYRAGYWRVYAGKTKRQLEVYLDFLWDQNLRYLDTCGRWE